MQSNYFNGENQIPLQLLTSAMRGKSIRNSILFFLYEMQWGSFFLASGLISAFRSPVFIEKGFQSLVRHRETRSVIFQEPDPETEKPGLVYYQPTRNYRHVKNMIGYKEVWSKNRHIMLHLSNVKPKLSPSFNEQLPFETLTAWNYDACLLDCLQNSGYYI